MQDYIVKDSRDYHLISQTGVHQYCYPPHYSHNAIWDSTAGPDGKFYYALASEIATSGYVRLCSYDYRTNAVEELFKVEDVIMPLDRAIRASKFHSSICFMPDGRMIMTTHTTDRSPVHPTWMPIAYYHHLWEGFAGGNIIVYDPKTKKAENLGIPVPHESIYGAVYEPGHNALYFTGFLRGHLYRYGLEDKQIKDFGKVSETYSFRLVVGKDGNIYGASRTGYLYKVNTETLELTDLNYQFNHEPYDHGTRYNNLSIARTGPDGRLYMAVMYGRNLIALDTATGEFEDMGPYLPAKRYSPEENRNGVFGMDFDSKGVLWYVVTALNNYENNLEYGIPASLFRWDITRGGAPEWLGVVGTEQRTCAWNSELCITKDDILYITGSNHSLDGPDLTGIDLKLYEPTRHQRGGLVNDGYFDPKNETYIQSSMEIHEQEMILEANPTNLSLPVAFSPLLLWRALAPDHVEDSAVKSVFWQDAHTLCGICGQTTDYAFTVVGGVLKDLRPLCALDDGERSRFEASLDRGVSALSLSGPLPWYPGRQYKAVPCAAAKLFDGRTVIGTPDGMLAIDDGAHIFSLGTAAVNGPVHCLCATPDGKTIYGVAGDDMDIGNVFSYTDEAGLRWLGNVGQGVCPNIGDVFYCTYITSCAISPDGKYLAIGAEERIGTVVIYQIA